MHWRLHKAFIVTPITVLPDCIVDLPTLQSVLFYFGSLNKIPETLFSSSTIKEIGFIFTNVTLESFITSSEGGYGANMTIPDLNYDSDEFYRSF